MTLTGGKRKVNRSLKSWVAFVKKVQKEEKLSYKDAIHRAKQRKDKGEKWMKGGGSINNDSNEMEIEEPSPETDSSKELSPVTVATQLDVELNSDLDDEYAPQEYIDENGLSWGMGGRRKRCKKRKTYKKRRTAKRRSSRRY